MDRIVVSGWDNWLVKQTEGNRLHIIEGTDWKDAIIALLDDRSPYRPWRYGFGEAHEGDPVAIVLNTDPPSVMTALGRIAGDGRTDRAVVKWPIVAPSLLDLTTLTVVQMLGATSPKRDFRDAREPCRVPGRPTVGPARMLRRRQHLDLR